MGVMGDAFYGNMTQLWIEDEVIFCTASGYYIVCSNRITVYGKHETWVLREVSLLGANCG